MQLLDDELRELVIERRSYRPVIRYFSGQADDEPFLLGYFPTPDRSGAHISGMLGFRVNLTQMRQRVLPALLRHLKTSDAVVLALLDNNNDFVIGAAKPRSAPIATLVLSSPFEFWQVGVFLERDEHPSPLADFSTLLWLWLISGLLFSIFSGAYIFIRYARHEARLSELKSTFVSRVSHELRTPSTSIKMLAEHLEMQLRNAATATEPDLRMRTIQYLSVIRRESDRLGRLVENVFDFSKIERGVKQYNFEYEMLGVVVQSAIASFLPHAEAQGFQVRSDIDDSLPELLLDADGMTQAILNLLSNAVKYSDKEKIIDVRAHRNGDHAYVEVEDRGIGISAAQTARIFDEFYRVDQKLNSKHQGGVGLGLTLVQHIVQAHRGTIEVRSEESKGSTFVITLPLLPDESPTMVAAQKATNPLDHLPSEITA
jgi:two-component system phosphate regulon sensor histidine kinase PhoR